MGHCLFRILFPVPANRLGYQEGINGFQLKMIQEVITLTVFCFFAVLYLKESLRWNYLIAFGLLLGAVYFMFKK
nr:DMT family protein [Chitinophaga sedimenti]